MNFEVETNIQLAPTVQNEKFLQKLDHFSPTDIRTWKQVCNLHIIIIVPIKSVIRIYKN